MNSSLVQTPFLNFKENIQKDGIYQTTVNYWDKSLVNRNIPPYKLFHFLKKNSNLMPWSYHYLAFWMLLTIDMQNRKKWLQNLQRNNLPSPLFWRVQASIHSCSGKCFYSLMSAAYIWFLCQEHVSKLAVANSYIAICLEGKVEENPSVTLLGHAHKWLKSATKKACKSRSERDWWCLWDILSGCQRGVCSWGLRIIFVEGFYH